MEAFGGLRAGKRGVNWPKLVYCRVEWGPTSAPNVHDFCGSTAAKIIPLAYPMPIGIVECCLVALWVEGVGASADFGHGYCLLSWWLCEGN